MSVRRLWVLALGLTLAILSPAGPPATHPARSPGPADAVRQEVLRQGYRWCDLGNHGVPPQAACL